MLRSRNFLGVLQLAASGIKEPNFKRRAGLLRHRFVQFGVINAMASGCEGRRHMRTNAVAEIVTGIFFNIANHPVPFGTYSSLMRCGATAHGRLMLTVLGGLAEVERHLILSRIADGRVRAKARGVKFGRRPKLTKHQQAEARERIAQGEPLLQLREVTTSVT